MSKRIQVILTDVQAEYVLEISKELGISQSGFVNMCIANYKRENEAMEAMKRISSLGIEDMFKSLQLMENRDVEK